MIDMIRNYMVERGTSRTRIILIIAACLVVALAGGPFLMSANNLDHLIVLFIYIILAISWNALAGYGGLVSVGQQAFFGIGAYAAIRLSYYGVPVYLALPLGGGAGAAAAWLASLFMLQLRGGEFAIGMWVLATLIQQLVSLDPLIQGSTGTSLLALNHFAPASRRADTYWLSLVVLLGLLGVLFWLLRSRQGAAMQAIRDDEEAARSIGVAVAPTKRLVFVFAGFGAGMAGALWLAASITFQPGTYFGVQWTAYMIFMVLVGGIGTFEGPILGAVLFFALETIFGATGVWYLIGLGAASVGFALLAPRGIWGALEARLGWRLLPVGYRLVLGLGFAGSMTAPSMVQSDRHA
jgi:branched-chain amino acid transport system permease protein